MEIDQIKFSNQFFIQQTQQWANNRVEEKLGYNGARLKIKAPSHPSADPKEIVILKTWPNHQLLAIPADVMKGCRLINEGRKQ